ncbi:hypothetical protein LCGC14_1212080 [marine sediment metagenome]|uniref:Uncharacterized protein n=1 Tax=marine sediment metagenome TaxID=412755 RepID=A0A0F9PIB7_9ZZZZ
MPYADTSQNLRVARNYKRGVRHGKNWRQIYVDCGGMCQGRLEDESLCGSVDGLEFHELYEGINEKKIKFQPDLRRTLLCATCHGVEHGFSNGRYRGHRSYVAEDIDYEVRACGGVAKWMAKYGLVKPVAVPGGSE